MEIEFVARLRSAAARMRTGLRAFSTFLAPRLPGLGIQQPSTPPTNRAAEARIAGRDALEARITYGAGPMLDRHSTYPATQLDPLKIESILREADLGIVYRYADLCQQVLERDAHLYGVDRSRRQSVANKPFLIQPKNDTPLAKALAHYLREVVDDLDGFPTSVYQLLNANCAGYAAAELVWAPGVVRFPGVDGRLVRLRGLFPRSLAWVHGKHFQFARDSDEPLLDLGTDGAVHLPPHKFAMHLCPGDGIAATRGYIRPVVWLHYLKHSGLRDLGIFLHIYGIPQLYGRVERGIWNDERMRRVLELALIAYGSGESAPILPEGLEIDAKPGPLGSGAADAHQLLAGLCNFEISKAVQSETLTTEPGTSGSYNLGVVHADSKHEVTVGDALSVAADLRTDLFISAIELNAYALACVLNADPEELVYALPRCEFRTDRETSPKERGDIITRFADAGLRVSVSQLRREYGLDVPTGEEDVLQGTPITVSAGGAAVGSTLAADGVHDRVRPIE